MAKNFYLFSSIMDFMKLTVSEPVEEKVSGRYIQRISYDGQKCVLTVGPFHTEHGPFIRKWEDGRKTVAVPVSPSFKQTMEDIEKFIESHVIIPENVNGYPNKKLRALNMQHQLFVTMSRWCDMFKIVLGHDVCITEEDFGKGEYTVTIEVSHIYVGPHQNGANYSLSL